MLLAISDAYLSDFTQVFVSKETSYVKISSLYKWWKFTLQIVFFFFECVVITTR